MKRSKIQELPHGLYLVYWKSGGQSLAAVGSMSDGTRWLAPCNWIIPTTIETVEEAWKLVKSMTLVCAAGDCLTLNVAERKRKAQEKEA